MWSHFLPTLVRLHHPLFDASFQNNLHSFINFLTFHFLNLPLTLWLSWLKYVSVKLTESASPLNPLGCAAKGCTTLLEDPFVEELLSTEPDLMAKWKRRIVDAYVMSAPNMRWCPGKGCVNAVKVEVRLLLGHPSANLILMSDA